MQMSEILSSVLNNASAISTMNLSLSEEDKKEFQMIRFEKLVERDLHNLLIAGASEYHTIADDDLLAYVKGAAHRYERLPALVCLAAVMINGDKRIARYRREMFLYHQVILRIQRERTRRIIAEVDAKLRE